MGVLLSRFKVGELASKAKHLLRKKTTLEILENLEKNINSIEETRQHTEQRQKKIVGHLILYSVGTYIIAALLFYFLFFPASLQDQLFYITPLLIFPIIVVLLKRLVTWYYRRKLTRNEEKLFDMREEKKKLLEDVMDKETYKVAKDILEKFAPDQLRKSSSMVISPPRLSTTSDLSLQRRSSGLSPSPPRSTPSAVLGPPSTLTPTSSTDVRKRSFTHPQGPPRLAPPVMRDPLECLTPGQTNGQGFTPRPPGPPMPRPILPRERSYLDKLVEYLVGDGPSNRYALICKQCASHNGMALKEEFEYFAFRCCYCYYWNPARKQRPQAPRLPSNHRSPHLLPGHTSASEVESASESEEGKRISQLAEVKPSHPILSLVGYSLEQGLQFITISESGSEQPSESESLTKEGAGKISEVAAAEDLKEPLVPEEPSQTEGTEDKPVSAMPEPQSTNVTES